MKRINKINQKENDLLIQNKVPILQVKPKGSKVVRVKIKNLELLKPFNFAILKTANGLRWG